ncbi:hypothetical protein IKG16_02925 [Candidatus Saccharibacteria bacterium]|nr:hypothetical protein [Candidatus Saccharibacteria bacterium]
MFFDNINDIEMLAEKSGFTIFVLPEITDNLQKESDKNHLVIFPEDEKQITIDSVRAIIEKSQVKQTKPYYIYVYHAELMNENAENAFLKLLEEPAKNYHYVLFTDSLSALLPTIISRGDLYIKRIKNPLNAPVKCDDSIKKYAKRIISAKDRELVGIITEMLNQKEFKKNARALSMKVCETAIEILYKSYFATDNPIFLKKLPKFITAYENLKQNGHIKLHLIADLC